MNHNTTNDSASDEDMNEHMVQPIVTNTRKTTLNAYPLCFHSTMLESELVQRECSDGIYVSSRCFRHFNRTDSDELVILKLTYREQITYATISGVHSEGIDNVMIPTWMCQQLECDCGDAVSIELFSNTRTGLNIRIQPHTSGYATLDDPVTALSTAFEHYTVLVSGMTIPLFVNGSNLLVNIIDTHSNKPICIRGMELAVEIDTPLDMPVVEEEPLPKRSKIDSNTLNAIEYKNNDLGSGDNEDDFNVLPSVVQEDKKFPGKGYALGSRR
jgi:hypothetical protein